jgi:hypothetical protein
MPCSADHQPSGSWMHTTQQTGLGPGKRTRRSKHEWRASTGARSATGRAGIRIHADSLGSTSGLRAGVPHVDPEKAPPDGSVRV